MKTIGFICAAFFMGLSAVAAAEAPGLQVGQSAPLFEAKSYTGETVSLADYLEEGPVVLVFYRGAWCPYCNLHLKQLQANLEAFEEYGAAVIAVSVDNAEKAAATAVQNELGFEVITDSQAAILESYGVTYTLPEELARQYKEAYQIDLQAHSGRADHMIAIPATYVIDPEGRIVFAYVNEDYKTRAQPEVILEALKGMGS